MFFVIFIFSFNWSRWLKVAEVSGWFVCNKLYSCSPHLLCWRYRQHLHCAGDVFYLRHGAAESLRDHANLMCACGLSHVVTLLFGLAWVTATSTALTNLSSLYNLCIHTVLHIRCQNNYISLYSCAYLICFSNQSARHEWPVTFSKVNQSDQE